MRNIEYKSELRDAALARTIALGVGASFILETEQTDTYYRVTTGKLKRREAPGEPVEYIHYERPEGTAARASEYTILTEQQALERFGQTPLHVRVVVKKRRVVYMMGSVRVHLDTVEGLGSFFELEALVTRECGEDVCRAAVEKLRQAFGPALGEAIATGYAEMMEVELEAKEQPRPRG